MKFTTKILRFLKNTKVIIAIVVIALVVVFFIFKNRNSEQNIFTLNSDNLAATGITVGGNGCCSRGS